MKSQKQFVIKQLLEKGKISRNFALKNYISRLGSIIFVLKEEGWDFKTYFIKTDKGKNFIYEVTRSPVKKKSYYVPEINKLITSYEK